MENHLTCKNCGEPRDKGRRLCRTCNLERLKASARNRPRYMWNKQCEACKQSYKAWRKTQRLCSNCYKDLLEINSLQVATNNYTSTKSSSHTVHREMAETILGRNLHYNEVVHHMDGNPKNNSVKNLIVLSRSWHGKLHLYLNL